MDSTTDVTVCMPWRAEPHREGAFARVLEWWQSRGFSTVLGDSGHERFNVAAARNAAVRTATTSIVIIADADTIPEVSPLTAAVAAVREHPELVVYPHDRYRYLGIDPATDLELATVRPERQFVNSVGGVLVTTTDTFWAVGGMDERFDRWGFEDNAFQLAASTLASVQRLPGQVHAFAHDADRDLSLTNPGRARLRLYEFASGRPDVMRELIR